MPTTTMDTPKTVLITGVSSSALKASPVAAVEGLAKLKASITAQEIKLASMRGYPAESAPDFKQAQVELSAMRGQTSRAENEEPTVIGGGGNSDYITKFTDFKYHETQCELFANQYEMARVDESCEGVIIQVVDAAQPPARKSVPKKDQIAMAISLTASFALLLIIFSRHALRLALEAPNSSEKFVRLRQVVDRR